MSSANFRGPRGAVAVLPAVWLVFMPIARAMGQSATLTFPNGASNSGPAQMALQGSRGPTPLLYAANSAAGDAKVLQFVETGCAGQTYGVWGITYSPDGTGVVGIAGLDFAVCNVSADGNGVGVKGVSQYT